MNDVTTEAGNTECEVSAAYAGGQYLTFVLAGEEYGVEILKVQEIKGWENTTAIPNTPEHVLGVLNLRGSVVPIVDLRKRFGMPSASYGPTTVIIVVKIQAVDAERTVGLVVDGVADVYRLEEGSIQPPPDMGNSVETEFVRGLATVDGKMVILLEIDALIDFDEAAANVGGSELVADSTSTPDAAAQAS